MTPAGGRSAMFRAALACVLAAHAVAAHAQDFEGAGPAGPARAPGGFIDTGLAPAGAGAAAQAFGITRYALPELSTRGVAAGATWRSLRLAAGWSQTGDPEIGWNAVGAAGGVANARWGAGLRAVARRDRTVLDPLARWGGELGGGVWLRLDAPLAVWASAPAAWTAGGSPPLARGLALGVIAGGAGASAWFEHEARPEAMSAQAAHRAGVALEAAGITVWAEGLDAPLRAALGIEAQAALLTIALSVVSHPLLGETVRAALTLGGTARGAAGTP